MKKATLLLGLFMVTFAGYGQGLSGTYKVGTSETAPNFALLSEAVTALNTNGLAGDVVLEITSDINETVNIGLVNESAHTLTIRPDGGGLRTVTFNKATDNAGPSGAFCIGIDMTLAWAGLKASKNIIIDGYAQGGSERQLKIATTDEHHNGNNPILLMDDCSNIQIKNTIIEHKGTVHGRGNYGIYLRVDTRYGTKKMPSNILIENNDITCVKNSASQGIGLFAGSNVPSTVANGVVIKNNMIKARTRGILLYYTNGIKIIGNEFEVMQTNSDMLSSGIYGVLGLEGDIIVSGNKFKKLVSNNSKAGDYGMKGVVASGGGTWLIDNNFFAGLDKGDGEGETKLNYIRTGSPCVIRHNTFHMKSLNKKPTANVADPTDAGSHYAAISIAAGTPEIKNNIFVSEEAEVTNLFIRGTNGGESDNNVFYFASDNTKAYINGTTQTLAAYQAANTGKDANSKFAAVAFADAATGDLSITGSSIQDPNLRVPALTAVSTDIFGKTRATDFTYAGAHESKLPFISTSISTPAVADFFVKHTPHGIEVELPATADIELYTINGALVDKTRVSGTYSRALGSGMYIIRVNGKAQKFAK